MNAALETLLPKNRLKFSANKSSLALVTPSNNEKFSQSSVTLYNIPIPINPNPYTLWSNTRPNADNQKTHRHNKHQNQTQTEPLTNNYTHQLRTLQGTYNNSIQTVQ